MKSYALAVAVGTCVLTGCATSTQNVETKEDRCSIGSCTIFVKVDAAAGQCRVISVDKDPLNVRWFSHNIFWTFADGTPNDYTFAENGIVFRDPKDQMTDPERQSDKRFKVHDRNTVADPTPFKYNVNVMRSGTRCPTFDPAIVNQG